MDTETVALNILVPAIAQELTALSVDTNWKYEAPPEDNNWRARIISTEGEILFVSNTWGKKGMLYIGGEWPASVDVRQISAPGRPSINVSLLKTPEQMAKDITRRLLPEYRNLLAEVLRKHVADCEYKEAKRKLIYQVAEVTGGKTYNNGQDDIVHGRGSFDVQVTGKDSMRLYGHCLSLTLDQLKRIVAAVPELWNGHREEA